MSWRKISRTSMDHSAFQFSHGSIKEFFLLTIYFLYMCLLRETNITVSQSSSSIPISCLLARCINDVKTSFKLNWWINIGFYGLRNNSLNAKICSVLFMLNKQNERREWAGEGGRVMVLNFHISREGGYRCEPSSRNLREIKIWLWG